MSAVSSRRSVIGLLLSLVLCYAVSAIGALANFQAQSFYVELIQPSWAPPGWLFGPVWTVLYGMMAVAAWLIWRQGGFQANRHVLILFGMQLVLNGLWSWVFFAWQQGLWSFINIVLLWVMILLTLLAFWRRNQVAGLLLVPYLLWVSFAAFLNWTIWQLNPSLLG